MTDQLHVIENEFWRIGILPETGASIAFAQTRRGGEDWVQVMRPTAEADYGNPSQCSSFIMLPWCNRIKDGQLRFGEQVYQLRTVPEGTAPHGAVRHQPWRREVVAADRLHLSLNSIEHPDINFPFRFSARALFWLERRDLVLWLALKNEDIYPMPGGFGHHPYFVRPDGDNTPVVQIPCDQYFELVNLMAAAAPLPIIPQVDFRQPRPLDSYPYNDLLTRRQGDEPVRITYPSWNLQLALYSDPIFQHTLIYAPEGKPFFAVEPMTNASDGFNLYKDNIPGSGVFVLLPGEEKAGMVRLRVRAAE